MVSPGPNESFNRWKGGEREGGRERGREGGRGGGREGGRKGGKDTRISIHTLLPLPLFPVP